MEGKNHITGIVLAGGKSSRMGTDKGFLMLNGKSFIEHSIDALKPLITDIIIVSDNPAYDIFGFKRVEDFIKDAGPLAGIYSGLNHSKSEYNLVLSCDIPMISSEILKKLIDGIDTISEVIQIESNGKTMPLIALYKKSCETTFFKLLNKGEKRLQNAVNHCQLKTIKLDFEEQIFTANVNTKEELKQIENANKH